MTCTPDKPTSGVIMWFCRPKDFTWDELVKVVSYFGYKELKKGKTGGSRRRFADDDKNIITLHKPHPSPRVKEYALQQVIAHLKEKGHI